MKLILKNLFFPKRYWTAIRDLGPTWNWTNLHLIVPSIVLVAISYFASIFLYGLSGRLNLADFKSLTVVMVVGGFLVYLQVETMLARIASRMASGRSDFGTVYCLVCFSLVPILIDAIVAPFIRKVEILPIIVAVALTLYSLALLYCGTSELLGIGLGWIKRMFLSLLIALFPFLISAIVLVALFWLSYLMRSRV
jgi:Yip1 domain